MWSSRVTHGRAAHGRRYSPYAPPRTAVYDTQAPRGVLQPGTARQVPVQCVYMIQAGVGSWGGGGLDTPQAPLT